MANSRVNGIAYFKIDGEVIELPGELTVNSGDPLYEEQIGSDGSVHFKVKYQVAMVEGELFPNGDPSIIHRLARAEPQTVTVGFLNGSTFVMGDAVWAGTGSMKATEGSFEGKFLAREGKWLPQ